MQFNVGLILRVFLAFVTTSVTDDAEEVVTVRQPLLWTRRAWKEAAAQVWVNLTDRHGIICAILNNRNEAARVTVIIITTRPCHVKTPSTTQTTGREWAKWCATTGRWSFRLNLSPNRAANIGSTEIRSAIIIITTTSTASATLVQTGKRSNKRARRKHDFGIWLRANFGLSGPILKLKLLLSSNEYETMSQYEIYLFLCFFVLFLYLIYEWFPIG